MNLGKFTTSFKCTENFIACTSIYKETPFRQSDLTFKFMYDWVGNSQSIYHIRARNI